MAKKGHFFLGFILGATSALATTYLLTPQTSDELRRKFSQKKDDLADRAADYYDYAKDAADDWRETAADVIGDVREKFEHKPETPATYDDQTQALKDELTAVPDVPETDDFDDIVLDGKSAFAQAKDAEAADDAPETDAAEPAADTETKPESDDDIPF